MLYGCFVFVATFFYLGSATVNAIPSTIHGLVLSPLRSEYEIAPGSEKPMKIQATNATTQPIDVDFHAEAFNVTNQQYDVAFDVEAKIAEWVIFTTPNVHLDPGQTKSVNVIIRVPDGAEPGGQYISIFATNSIKSSDSSVNSEQRIASLVYLTVQGRVTRNGSLQSVISPLIYDENGTWNAAILNSGTAHFWSKYTVTLRNLFGDEDISKHEGKTVILPKTTRLVTAKLPLPSHLGIYRVDYTIGLGDSSSYKKTTYTVYIPRAAHVSLGIVMVLGALGLVYCVKYLKHLWKRKKNTD